MKNLGLFLFLFLSFGFFAFAQVETEDILILAKKELDAACDSGTIREFVLKNEIKGTYNFELTIKGKGQIVNMNIRNRGEYGTITQQNALKDFLMNKFRFSFKMPKERYFKFEYPFSF
ncbi:MAG: hypothetical protein SGI87_02140 [Flavobacteriales bacterium]|nr:hypothetical protein [Flavobacteriales bacterium]